MAVIVKVRVGAQAVPLSTCVTVTLAAPQLSEAVTSVLTLASVGSVVGLQPSALPAGTVDELLFDEPYPLTDGTRFSISNFVWRGFDAAAWGGATRNRDEEIVLTEEWPRETNRTNVVNGRALVVHYSFFGQRPFLEEARDATRVLRATDDHHRPERGRTEASARASGGRIGERRPDSDHRQH